MNVREERAGDIDAVATLRAAQLRGSTAMTAAPLLEARTMGYCVGILQAS